jgi:MFS family permease
MDLLAILLITPLSDRYYRHRALFFSISTLVQIAGLLTITFAPQSASWSRYAGLLLVGFGLGPTVPICMTWTSEIFQARHGEVGVAAASALVSGLGNLGSIITTYALYTGWPSDAAKGPTQYRRSNLAMIGILGISIASSVLLTVVLKVIENRPSRGHVSDARACSSDDSGTTDQGPYAPHRFRDGAARREVEQRGLSRLWCN